MTLNFNRDDLGKIWKKIVIRDETFIICVTKECSAWKVLLTNFKEIWSESLSDEEILEKSKKLNSTLIIPDNEHMDVVLETLNDIPEYASEVSTEQIKLLKNFEGGRFKFEINFSKGTTEEFWENVTKPLHLSSIELMRRQNILMDLIKRKDEEIAEYKAEGGQLLRKNIETKVFNEDQLKMNAIDWENKNRIDSFQTVVEFYNKTISKHSVKVEGGTSITSANTIGRQDPTSNVAMKDEPDSKCFESISKANNKRNRKNKISTINIAPVIVPSKKNKESIADIL